ncbi:unnamed protein product [Chrysoparadoxa australica]
MHFVLVVLLCSFLSVAAFISPAVTCNHERRGSVLQESVDLDVFDLDMDVGKIDLLNDRITEVKMMGVVPSANLVFDCSHGEWLLMQIGYDRNIRRFCCKSRSSLGAIAEAAPEKTELCFSGTLLPKHIKRLLRTTGLTHVVVSDVDTAVALEEAISKEEERVGAKTLNRVSKSRENFLMQSEGGEAGPGHGRGGIAAFLRVTPESTSEGVAALTQKIRESCRLMPLAGMWCEELEGFEVVKGILGKDDCVVLPFAGEEAKTWVREKGPTVGLGRVWWTFDYE